MLGFNRLSVINVYESEMVSTVSKNDDAGDEPRSSVGSAVIENCFEHFKGFYSVILFT